MMRVFWVTAVLCALTAALAGTRNYQPAASTQVTDELLAYEIASDKSVTVNIPAKVDLALLTAWLVIPPQPTHDAEHVFSSSIDIQQRSPSGRLISERPYTLDTRATMATSTHPLAVTQVPPGTVHRLVDSNDWVCDPRTIEVDLSALAKTGGQLRVHMADGLYSYALLRLSYRFSRSGAERQLLEAGMSDDEAQNLIQGATALGFSDLPAQARRWALSSWGRRLTAVGRTGTDYSRRRLLLGPRHSGLERNSTAPDTFALGPNLQAALNVTGTLHLELEGPPGAVVGIRQRRQPDLTLALDHHGFARQEVPGATLRTIVLSSVTPIELRASLPQSEGLAQYGDIKRILRHDTRVALVPDYRNQTYYRLHPTIPLKFNRAPNEGPFRLRVRAAIPAPDSPPNGGAAANRQPLAVRVRAELHSKQQGIRSVNLDLTLPASSFESFANFDQATDSATAHLFSGEETRLIALYGPAHVAVSAMVSEPGVEESIPDPAYATGLPADVRFKNIPYMSARWASIRPAHIETLRATGRQLSLRTQVRIVETSVNDTKPLPEQAIYPRGYPPRRTVLVENGQLDPTSTSIQKWFPITTAQRVQFPAAGQTPGRLRLRYHVPVAALGQELLVELDNVPAHRQTLRLTSGIVKLKAPAGPHQLSIRGLPTSATLEVDKAPPGAQIGLRRYSYNELSIKRPLTFRIAKRPGTVAHVAFLVATESPRGNVNLRYTVDDGHPSHKDAVFVQSATSPSGLLETQPSEAGTVRQNAHWENFRSSGQNLGFSSAHLSKARIRLGDDLKKASHLVKLSLPMDLNSRRRVWVRAVLIGQPLRRGVRKHRMYLGAAP